MGAPRGARRPPRDAVILADACKTCLPAHESWQGTPFANPYVDSLAVCRGRGVVPIISASSAEARQPVLGKQAAVLAVRRALRAKPCDAIRCKSQAQAPELDAQRKPLTRLAHSHESICT